MRAHMHADSVLLCLTGRMISDDILGVWDGHPTALMMWDSVRRYDMDFQQRLRRYQHIFAFEFTDIAGIVKGASKGEGLGNKFLSHIREVDAIVQVLRHFNDSDIVHVE